MASPKPIHTIVLDAGPMLKNDPSISSLLAKADRLVTVPAVIPEIRDATARSRIESTWKPFLETIAPSPQSLKAVTDFARKTGDLIVLSRPDLHILALTYEVEIQRSGLSNVRTFPGQRLEKPKPPGIQKAEVDGTSAIDDGEKAAPQSTTIGVAHTASTSYSAESTRGDKPAV
ncbi:MAG: hypothetical protein Q9198_004905, partial [Flavoplaca austrocitrina]